MTPQRSSSMRREPMSSLLPVDQDESSRAPFSGHEPWQQSAHHHDSTSAPFHFEHLNGNLLAPDGMDFSTFDGISSALPKIHTAHSFMPEEIDGLCLQDGLFDASLQYGLPKHSPSIHEEIILSGPWNHGMDTGAGRPATDLNSIAQYGTISLAPALDNFEVALTSFESCPMPQEQRVSTSPSQYSSVTGSLSIRAAMDLSRRSSIVYSSNSAVSNSIEQAQSDTHPTPLAATAAGTAAEFPSKEIEAITGMSSRQSVHATKDNNRKKKTGSAEAFHAPEYSAQSSKPTFRMASTANDEQSSLSPVPSHSKPNVPQAPTPITQGTQLQRNRRAAVKCREKTKAAMAQLEATERAVSLQHMELSKTVADLRGEVLALKNQLLLHGNCDCDAIQQYLRNAARSIGEGSSINYASSQSRVAAWTNPPGLGRHHSFS
ncbi:hypothetical protein N0V93_008074 [Gnomoniopsis smithogilvyi]|uniref:BZIP domain-containing protein n=1 Tax=Gnomoniopsis smithogilvyi TaxID=1191159 RepID=A0A9W9CUE9_9PEZI|nr:hypothetical protein N0V93_008074 [Gnomoniopsis smithogilvyi]